jgi:hypothetical protein
VRRGYRRKDRKTEFPWKCNFVERGWNKKGCLFQGERGQCERSVDRTDRGLNRTEEVWSCEDAFRDHDLREAQVNQRAMMTEDVVESDG